MSYIFMTDVSSELTPKQASDLGIEVIPMEFHMDDKSYLHYSDARMMSLDEFYTKLKNGAVTKTSQINYNTFMNYFETYLKAGKDILYTGISSGLSGTFSTCLIAVKELQGKYPDRKIVAIDSTCDSLGLGLLLTLAGEKYASGASIEELTEFIEETKQKVCHWFVVDDLDQLKRGGRISALTSAFGKALQIKPLLSVDKTGALFSFGKIRGKNKRIPTLISRMQADAEDLKNNIITVAYSDNPEDAKELKKAAKGLCKDVIIYNLSPIIGSHVGSGLLAISFLGKRP